MARKKNEFLKAFGTSYEIFTKIGNAVLDAGGTDDDLRRILSNKDLVQRLAETIVASRFASGNMVVSSFFPVAIDHSRTVVGMMKELKIYAHFDDRHLITPDMFKFEGVGRLEVEVATVEFNEPTAYEPEEILDRLDKSGLQHAEIKHLFAFAERYPEMAFSDYILAPGCGEGRRLADLVAMGSPITRTTDGGKGYPFFGWSGINCHRYLSVVWNLRMPVRPRLLVVRK